MNVFKNFIIFALYMGLLVRVWAQNFEPIEYLRTLDVSRSSSDESELNTINSLLLGNLLAQEGYAEEGIDLILDNAQRNKNEKLFEIATKLAILSYSGDRALLTTKAWISEFPNSIQAQIAHLKVTLGLQNVTDSLNPLRKVLSLVPSTERTQAIESIPSLYKDVLDFPAAIQVVQTALKPYLQQPAFVFSSHFALAHLYLQAQQYAECLGVLNTLLKLNAKDTRPLIVAFELFAKNYAESEALIQKYLVHPLPKDFRLQYANLLSQQGRYIDAESEIQKSIMLNPTPIDWMILAQTQLDQLKWDNAQSSALKVLELTANEPGLKKQSNLRDRAFLI
ncbi:MAG: hypothetical protein QM520_06185, partial [Gammaproteobacteria bacterium]|nr:hypothetical protein [Gammaproteobacteria bacterium]